MSLVGTSPQTTIIASPTSRPSDFSAFYLTGQILRYRSVRDGISGLSGFTNHASDHCDDTACSSIVRGELDNARELERVLFKERSDEEAARRDLSIVVRVRSKGSDRSGLSVVR